MLIKSKSTRVNKDNEEGKGRENLWANVIKMKTLLCA